MKEFAVNTAPILFNIATFCVIILPILILLLLSAHGRKTPPYELAQPVFVPLRVPGSERSSRLIEIPPHSQVVEKFPAKLGLHQLRIMPIVVYAKAGEEGYKALPPPPFDARLLMSKKGLSFHYETGERGAPIPQHAIQNTAEWRLMFRSVLGREFALALTNNHEQQITLQVMLVYSPPGRGDKRARGFALATGVVIAAGIAAFGAGLILKLFT